VCDSAHFVRARARTAHCARFIVKNVRKTGCKFAAFPGMDLGLMGTINQWL